MDGDIPEQVAVGDLAHVHELLQQLNRRNGDDRRQQLEFEGSEIDLAHPLGPIAVAAMIDARDEILIAGKNDDHDQRAGEREIDQREYAQYRLGFRGREGVQRNVHEFLGEVDEQNDEREGKAQVERRQEPPTSEDQGLDPRFDLLAQRQPHAPDLLFVPAAV